MDYDTEEADVDTDFDHGLMSRISVNESDSSQMQGQCRSEVLMIMLNITFKYTELFLTAGEPFYEYMIDFSNID